MKESEIAEYLWMLSAVIDCGSFSKAAEQLQLSQLTVSRKVHELENHIGEKLIERTSKGIRPLPGALKLHISYKSSLNRLELFLNSVKRDPNKYQGPVKLAVPTVLGYFVFSAYVAKFLQEHSEVKLLITITDNEINLINDDFDLIIADCQPKWQNTRYKHLYTVSNGIYANEKYIQLNRLGKKVRGGHVQRYAAINLINHQSGLSAVSRIDNMYSLNALPIFSDQPFYGSLPDIFSDSILRKYALKRVGDDKKIINKSYYLIRNSEYITPALRKVIDFIEECIINVINSKHYQYPEPKEWQQSDKDLFDEQA